MKQIANQYNQMNARNLGPGSGKIVEEELKALRESLRRLAGSKRMKANIKARSKAKVKPDDALKSSLLDTPCALLMHGPGYFLCFRYYQKIHDELKIAELAPLLYLSDILECRGEEVPASDLIDHVFSEPDSILPIKKYEIREWLARVLLEVGKANSAGQENVKVVASSTIYDNLSFPGSIELSYERDLWKAEQALTLPLSSRYQADDAAIYAEYTFSDVVPKDTELWKNPRARLKVNMNPELPPAAEDDSSSPKCTLFDWSLLQRSGTNSWSEIQLRPSLTASQNASVATAQSA